MTPIKEHPGSGNFFSGLVDSSLTGSRSTAYQNRPGFSVLFQCVNKHSLAENLLEENLVARRMLCEQVGGALEKNDLNSLLLSCKNSNARWKETLKGKRD